MTREQSGRPHTFADIKGKGHYVGTLLQAQGLKAGMTIFFEGDDSTSIDGSFQTAWDRLGRLFQRRVVCHDGQVG